MSSEQLELEIQKKGLTAPRVTLEDVKANIAAHYFFTVPDLSLLTFCVIKLRNGFTVTGEAACVSPENYDAEIGRKIAFDNAFQKIWPLMGYALKEKLSNQ